MRRFRCSATDKQTLTCHPLDQPLTNACIPKPPSLIGFWPGDGNGNDLSGNGNDGTYSGLYTVGKTNQAFSIQGTGNVVTIPNAAILEPTTLTMNAWVRGNQPTDYKWIVAKGASNCDSGSYGLYVTPTTNNIRAIVYNGSSFGVASAIVPGIWDDNWHMVSGSYDGNTVKLYVDGLLVSSTVYGLAIAYGLPTDNNLLIGGYNAVSCPPGNNYSFEGDIDEVQLYSGALSDSAILDLFNSGADSICRFVEVNFDINGHRSGNCSNQGKCKTRCVIINQHGVTVVRIYGTETLDVRNIDCSSLLFGGLKVKNRNGRYFCEVITENHKSQYPILQVEFDNTSAVFDNSSIEIILSGNLNDGTLIGGSLQRCII